MTEQTEQPEQQSNWYKDSILFKLGIITVVVMLLLIPSAWIEGLVVDREGYQKDILNNVAENWAGPQLVQGPVLLVPYKKQVTETGEGNHAITHEVVKTLYVLPQTLQIKAVVTTNPLQKGVYDATVYNSSVSVNGSFDPADLAGLGIDPATVLYDKARLVFSISDMKGLTNNPAVKLQEQLYNPEPAVDNQIPFEKGLQVNFPLQKDKAFTFSYQLELKGTNNLQFLQTGKTTNVEVSSNWTSPDFDGRYLPDTSTVNNKGFDAKWRMLYYNRPFPQQWADDHNLLKNTPTGKDAVFGVRLHVPVDQYRKILRTTKYDTLIIVLTFVSLFLAEMIRKQRIHVFNYILIGAAMVVYYTLLLSFAEQIGYNYAYLVASSATIGLISLFTASLLNNKNVAVLFAFILTVFYGFIFIIIQLESLALLFGSIALFIVVAALMYFSRKINWDRQ